MSFSSNQVLSVSGRLGSDLEDAFKFALEYSGHSEHFVRRENPSDCVYQITKDGRYCVGWHIDINEPYWVHSRGIPEGWSKYPFDFDVHIIASIINNHLDKQDIDKEGLLDLAYEKGFIMSVIPENPGSMEADGIKHPFYGIVVFKPYICYYSK